jgi:predicted nucleotidyltransferase component of viral defense system
MFDPYLRQIRLLVRCLPEVAKQDGFALKGGTAINLFFREMPRLSVDIDLAYLPLKSRNKSLEEISLGLETIASSIRSRIRDSVVQEILSEGYRVKLIVRLGDVLIKIEPNLVFRGSVFAGVERKLVSTAQQQLEADVSVTTLSEADLYGGKLCAALDRQHPRDLFDVRELWNAGGLTEEIRQAFVVYLAGHPRPMSEVLAPRLKSIEPEYKTQFQGMSVNPVRLEDLVEVQHELGPQLRGALTDDERAFLVSIQQGEPEWERMRIGHLRDLPALQWKLLNVARMTPLKRRQAVAKLQEVLGGKVHSLEKLAREMPDSFEKGGPPCS